MANISSEKIWLQDSSQFLKVIKYSKGKFSARLPVVLCNDLLLEENDFTVYADTEKAVNNLFDKKLDEWKNVLTVKTMVILFRAKFQGALAKKTFKARWENGYTPSFRQHGISDSKDIWEFNKQQLEGSSS